MGQNNLGLGLVIKAQDAASAVFKRVGKSMQGVKRMAGGVGKGVGLMAQGIRGAALGFAPFTLGMGLGIKAAASFQGQMQVVKSVMGDAGENMAALKAEARRVGLVTSKSSVEAAQGLELLGRAGFSSKEAIQALQPVVNAAEADGMGLARTAEIVSDNLNAFGQDADQARRFAGVLAFTSANTATNIEGLGQGMKFAGPIAKQLGLSFEDTALSLGFIANSGLKAGQAGTALKNMMVKLAKPSSKAKSIMKDLGVEFADSKGNMKPFNEVVGQLIKKIPEMGGNMEQVAGLAELFGLRGQGAASALVAAFTKLEKKGKLKELQEGIKNAADAAEKMSATRLEGLSGAMTILGGTVETVATVAFEPFLPLLENIGKTATLVFNDIGIAIGHMFNPTKEGNAELAKLNPTIVAIAAGFKDGFDAIKSGLDTVKNAVKEVGAFFGAEFGGDGIRKLVKFATIFAVVAAAIAPVAMAIVGIGFVIGPVITFIQGAATAIAALFSPAGAAILIVVGLVIAFRKQIMQFVSGVGEGFASVWDPLVHGLTAAWNSIMAIWTLLKSAIQSGADAISGSAGGIGQSVGAALGEFFLTVINKARAVIDGLKAAVLFLMPVFRFAAKSVGMLVDAVGTLLGEIMEAVGGADEGGNAFQTMGNIVGVLAGAVAAAFGIVVRVVVAAIGIITPIIGGIISVIGSVLTIVGSVVQGIGALLSGDWATAWDAAKTIVFEVVKGIITIVGTMVQGIAAAIDGIGKIFGKDLGARDFMKNVQKDLITDVEKMIKGQEQIAREKAKARGAAKPKVPATAASAPPPQPNVAPQVTAFAAGTTAQPATAAEIAAAMPKTVTGNFTINSTLKMDQTQLATAVEKVQKKAKARGAR